MTEARPPLSPALSGAELRRWYWLKAELAGLARELGVSAAGGKHELTERLAAVLDGQPPPASARRRAAGLQLTGPLTPDTVLPAGQRCSQHLRSFFTAEIGPGFRFDGPMRAFVRAEAGRTLGEAVEHWHATRDRETAEIGPQFELNRFLRAWHAAHPGGSHADALAAWAAHRARPADERR